jgi:hypothetical protein
MKALDVRICAGRSIRGSHKFADDAASGQGAHLDHEDAEKALDSVGAEVEARGNLLVGKAADYQMNDLAFSSG